MLCVWSWPVNKFDTVNIEKHRQDVTGITIKKLKKQTDNVTAMGKACLHHFSYTELSNPPNVPQGYQETPEILLSTCCTPARTAGTGRADGREG